MADASAGPGNGVLVERIRLVVLRNARRWKGVVVLEAVGLALSAALAYLWLVFGIDNFVHLPVWGRLLANLGFIAGVVWLGTRLVRRWRGLGFTEDQVALAMERRTPGGVQNRLINAIQLARHPRYCDESFTEAAVQENCERLQAIGLGQAVQMRPALIRLAAAGILIGIGLAFWVLRPAHFANAATRIFLPFADVDPLYRTTLVVEPGDVEAVGDVTIHIHIRGERPKTLSIFRIVKAQRSSDVIPVEPEGGAVDYTFKAVSQSTAYAVQGGDFVSPFYRINVPTPSLLSLIRATYHYPDYTRLTEKSAEIAGGDLEALGGTRAHVNFVFDQEALEAVLLLHRAPGDAGERQPLDRVASNEFQGDIVFDNVSGYELQTRQADRAAHTSGQYALRVVADQPPKLELSGLEKQTEVAVDAILPVKIVATDDYGLDKVGLFYRRLPMSAGARSPSTILAAAGDSKGPTDNTWVSLQTWPANGALEFRKDYDFAVAALGVAEGERIEVLLRGSDSDPLKKGNWTDGTVYRFMVGGEGAALQVQYEQILQTEADIKGLIQDEQASMRQANEWMRKLEPGSGLRWDDQKNIAGLAAGVKEQVQNQNKTRQKASEVARAMVSQAGNLRLSLGLLADTEMIRAVRILESVSTRENPQNKRSALADARLTEERTIQSLEEILEHYITFRQDWELSHMVPFVKMLADRQGGLRDDSLRMAAEPTEKTMRRQPSARRRQAKIQELCGLAATALNGLAQRVGSLEPTIKKAFIAAAASLVAADLKLAMSHAAEHSGAGRWQPAARDQAEAARSLAAIHASLRQAQTEAARQVLTALQEKAKTDIEAQKALARLQAGTSENFLDLKDKVKLEEIIHMREQEAAKQKQKDNDPVVNNYLFPDSARSMLQQPDKGIRQRFDILSLAKTPQGALSYPKQSDRQGNKVSPHIQEKFEDLVGKLLEEADEMVEKYETYNLNTAFNMNEPGAVMKQAGSLNSTAAAAATGNMKPPTQNVGGASRSGRKGARAHGMAVGDESVNRRGRDKVQEGQDRVADQAGSMKEKQSSDPQKDTSTGVGGRKVESEENKFSLADAGKWTDDMAKRMGAPEKKNSIVERQGGRLDPRVAELLRDLDNRQEQLIERIKIVRKELRNLYLPTDNLDEIGLELAANLSSLKDRPNGELFRRQRQLLDKLRSSVRVFHQAHAGFQPSLPREQVIRDQILDEPARRTLPGYEEAVKEYYEKLSSR